MNIRSLFRKIREFYDKNYTLFTGITAGVFLLQIVHLFWLTTHVVSFRLFGMSFFDPNAFWQFVIVVVDYLEIPAIISTSIIYIFSLGRKFNKKDLFLLLLLNTQWLHIFWISDEFVVDMFTGTASSTILPFWLAWVAIGIDYLELPVMYDTTKKFLVSFFKPKNMLRGGDSGN
ncbi:hypothetical protein KW786_01670 [Candidatus Parcubacteria bacterium]|nr:hypothetical protein [Candidatus Parcubacteria bacterium]